MKILAFATLLFSTLTCSAEPRTCLIVKLASSGSAFVHNANWEYVAGDFPKDMKFKGHITDRGIRKIKEKGGRVIVVPPNYTPEDLEQAKKTCVAQ